AMRFGGLEIDQELEFGHRHDWQVSWLPALENAADIDPDLPVHVGDAGAVAHQAPCQCIFPKLIDCRHLMLRYQCNQPVPSCIEKWISPDHKRIDVLLGKRSEASIDTLIASAIEKQRGFVQAPAPLPARLSSAPAQPACSGLQAGLSRPHLERGRATARGALLQAHPLERWRR